MVVIVDSSVGAVSSNFLSGKGKSSTRDSTPLGNREFKDSCNLDPINRPLKTLASGFKTSFEGELSDVGVTGTSVWLLSVDDSVVVLTSNFVVGVSSAGVDGCALVVCSVEGFEDDDGDVEDNVGDVEDDVDGGVEDDRLLALAVVVVGANVVCTLFSRLVVGVVGFAVVDVVAVVEVVLLVALLLAFMVLFPPVKASTKVTVGFTLGGSIGLSSKPSAGRSTS